MPTIQNQMYWDVINVPILKGVNLNTRNRMIEPDVLAKADNVYFGKNGGLDKRRGYKGFTLYDAETPLANNPPSDNLYGYGLFDPADEVPSGSCVYPQAGTIRDIITYGDSELAWDGWRLFKPVSTISGKSKVINAYLPKLKSYQVANTTSDQDFMDAGQTTRIRVVAYISAGEAYAKVYDLASGVLKFTAHLNHGSNDPKYVKVVSINSYCHVLVSDGSDAVVYCYIINDGSTDVEDVVTAVTANASGTFSLYKFNNYKFLVASTDGAGVAYVTWLKYSGRVDSSVISANSTPVINASPTFVSVAVHPVNENIALAYYDTSLYLDVYDKLLTPLYTVNPPITEAAVHVSVVPSYVDNVFYVYHDESTTDDKTVVNCYLDNVWQYTSYKYNLVLASDAIRVGNVPFIWAVNNTTYQSTYFLLDANLNIVGKTEYGTANYRINNESWLPSVNCVISNDEVWNVTKFYGALGYRERIGSTFTYADLAIKCYELDFLPEKLSYDTAGKAVYIAGAQLWSFDGERLDEASFPNGVEVFTLTDDTGGALEANGVYRYRVDLCYKNAQNEEVKAISFLSDEITLAPGKLTVDVEWVQPVTNRTDAYYMVYRNENAGTLWYLISSHDNPVAYDPTVATITYTDDGTVTDALLLDKEQHAANAGTKYLQPMAAPSCELVVFGQNRLWLSGGELLPGELWPSRLFYPGFTPSFNFALSNYVDKTTEPITALAFQADYGIIFKRNSTYILTGNVMGNMLDLQVAPDIQLALADRGCINFKSVIRLYNGVIFQSVNGYKIISAPAQMVDIGFPIESVHGNCIGAVLVSSDEHVRLYSDDNLTLVYDFRRNQWSTFSFNTKPSAAVLSGRTGMAVIARGNKLLYETENYYLDGGFRYHYTVRTAPLAAKIGGFQRVRRVYCNGERQGISPSCTLRVYHDCHAWWTEQVRWDYSDDLNTDVFGSGDFGEGFMGANTLTEFRDDIWRFRKRLVRQKCENIAVEITDKGRLLDKDNGWVPVAFALEVGTKNGIDRLSSRTFTKE